MATVTGGAGAIRRLGEAVRKVGGPRVQVGFLATATPYPDGLPVAAVAAIQEFGATIQRQPGQVTIYRQVGKDGEFRHGGRFVKASKANFASTHQHGAYVIVIPSRPFFRNMIAKHKAGWGDLLAHAMKQQNYDGAKALAVLGKDMEAQLVQSIRDTNAPKLAKSTIRRKGFDKPLIDTGLMWQSVSSEVTDGE